MTGCSWRSFVLVVLSALTEKQAYKAIDSQTIFIFGGNRAGKSAGNDRGRQAGCGLCNRHVGAKLLTVHAVDRRFRLIRL